MKHFSQKGNHSDVSEFVDSNSHFTSKPLTRRSIHNGIKHLSLRESFEGQTSVASATGCLRSGLNINQFKSLRYQQIQNGINTLYQPVSFSSVVKRVNVFDSKSVSAPAYFSRTHLIGTPYRSHDLTNHLFLFLFKKGWYPWS